MYPVFYSTVINIYGINKIGDTQKNKQIKKYLSAIMAEAFKILRR